MDADKFSQNVAVADFQKRPLTLVLDVLGVLADRGVGKNPVAASEFRRPFQHHVRHDLAVLAEFHVFPNHGKRADGDARSKLGLGMTNSCGVGFHEPGLSTIANRTIASATSLPSTVARPCILPKLLRRLRSSISTWS